MSKILSISCVVCLLICQNAMAQIAVLKKAAEKIDSYQNISYTQQQRQKNPFTGDWISLDVNTVTSKNPQGQGIEYYNIKEGRGSQFIYNGSKGIELDLNEKTYRLKDSVGEPAYLTPYSWARFIRQKLGRPYKKIAVLPDTVINKTSCFHTRIVVTDSASSREIHDFYLDKKTYLPVFIRQYLQGRFGKGDMVGESIVVMINESAYTNYQTGKDQLAAIAAVNIPEGFGPEKKVEPLNTGITMPEWDLKDLQGNAVSSEQLKGKVALIDFSFNACAACMLSIPMLKRLHEKYKDSGVQIITINTLDTKESVANFVKKNSITYPLLINGSQVSKLFRVSVYPTFYLIGKNGTVAEVIDGYSNELEGELINKIDKLK